MADTIGTVLGGLPLAASVSVTFISVVECFEYLQLNPPFGKDLNKSQARLEALKLQITRWGISSGILLDPQTGRHRVVNVDANTAVPAKRLLNLILEDTLELEKNSRRYSDQLNATNPIDSAQVDALDEPTQALKSMTSRILAKRMQGVSLQKKTKWALYEKKHFDKLLEDITQNLSLLILTPQLTKSQRELCRMEVEEIQSGHPQEITELLHDASKINNDILLEQAINEAISNGNPGHSWERTEVDGDVTLYQGDRIANTFTGRIPMRRGNHRFGVTIGKGKAVIHQGDVFGGCQRCLTIGSAEEIHQGDVYGGCERHPTIAYPLDPAKLQHSE